MNKLFKLFLSAAVVFMTCAQAFAYPDVSDNHWAAKQIQELTGFNCIEEELGVQNG